MGAFSGRLGTRFLVVTVAPNVLLFGYIIFLVSAGAPTRSPSLSRALVSIEHLPVDQIVAIVLGLLIFSIATHPLQVPIIQLLEGYWWGLPFGSKLADRATNRFRAEWDETQTIIEENQERSEYDWYAKNMHRHASNRMRWLPGNEADLLPTALGNTLWRGETVAGQRYRLDLDFVLPRLTPLMDSDVLAELSDLRNQLDAAARLCAAGGIATAVSVGMLLWHGAWLFMALAMYVLTWACYRSAIAAAQRFSVSLAAAVDLYHLKLYDALSLQRPPNLARERTSNALLSKLFSGELRDDEMDGFEYLPPTADEPTADQGKPETGAPSAQR